MDGWLITIILCGLVVCIPLIQILIELIKYNKD
jgi:hypothetical protein